MDYLDRIKLLKSQKKLTNEDLSRMTGIPLGTISKILAGLCYSPKFANLLAICDALDTNLQYVVYGIPENTNNFTLDRSEIRIIENYRSLDQHGKELAMMVLEKEKERILHSPYMGNSAGRKPKSKILPNAVTIDPDFSSNDIRISQIVAKRPISIYHMPVSAGAGVFLDSPSTDEIMIPDTERTREADYALRISGNSMEPKYRDGDVILVSNSDCVEVGELGIFILDGSGYFKVYGGDRLISMNTMYGDILLKDFENISCVGRVIGKLKRR